jgi:hypothetical protein
VTEDEGRKEGRKEGRLTFLTSEEEKPKGRPMIRLKTVLGRA